MRTKMQEEIWNSVVLPYVQKEREELNSLCCTVVKLAVSYEKLNGGTNIAADNALLKSIMDIIAYRIVGIVHLLEKVAVPPEEIYKLMEELYDKYYDNLPKSSYNVYPGKLL